MNGHLDGIFTTIILQFSDHGISHAISEASFPVNRINLQ
ncbi:hypothetical protein D1AOALGA4SA_3540 [Olavius algarvensis Delta 1 endosymbiont]|nr:hypothetical protein D1AOALGA4SA_3540 [Olavius algarvensis Delta 1 endosymbiont]